MTAADQLHTEGDPNLLAFAVLLDPKYLPYTRFQLWAGGELLGPPGDELEILALVQDRLQRIITESRRDDAHLSGRDSEFILGYLTQAIYGDDWTGPETTSELSERYAGFFILNTQSLNSMRITLLEEPTQERLIWTRDHKTIHSVELPIGYARTAAIRTLQAINSVAPQLTSTDGTSPTRQPEG